MMNIKNVKGISFYKVFCKKEINSDNLKSNTELKSPNGKYVFYTYATEEVRMGYFFGNFVLVNAKNAVSIVLGQEAGLVNWGTEKPGVWTGNSRYLIVDIYPGITKFRVVYRDGKLIFDLKLKRFTIIMIAGGFFYNNIKINTSGRVVLSKKPGARAVYSDNMHIDKADTHIDKLKWAPLEKFSDAVKLLEKGYFGNIVGYVNDVINIRFKKGFTPWPYKDGGIK
jgi:hypothetical protein